MKVVQKCFPDESQRTAGGIERQILARGAGDIRSASEKHPENDHDTSTGRIGSEAVRDPGA